MPSIGPIELIVILIIALVVFGPKRLPELGSSLGRGIREFRSSVSGSGGQEEQKGELREGEGERGQTETVDGEIVNDRRS